MQALSRDGQENKMNDFSGVRRKAEKTTRGPGNGVLKRGLTDYMPGPKAKSKNDSEAQTRDENRQNREKRYPSTVSFLSCVSNTRNTTGIQRISLNQSLAQKSLAAVSGPGFCCSLFSLRLPSSSTH